LSQPSRRAGPERFFEFRRPQYRTRIHHHDRCALCAARPGIRPETVDHRPPDACRPGNHRARDAWPVHDRAGRIAGSGFIVTWLGGYRSASTRAAPGWLKWVLDSVLVLSIVAAMTLVALNVSAFYKSDGIK